MHIWCFLWISTMHGALNHHFMGFVLLAETFLLMQIQQKECSRGFQYTFPGTVSNSTFSLMYIHSEFALFSNPFWTCHLKRQRCLNCSSGSFIKQTMQGAFHMCLFIAYLLLLQYYYWLVSRIKPNDHLLTLYLGSFEIWHRQGLQQSFSCHTP